MRVSRTAGPTSACSLHCMRPSDHEPADTLCQRGAVSEGGSTRPKEGSSRTCTMYSEMAEPELVNVFQAGTGTVLSPFTATTSCADAQDYLTAEYGAGVLKWTSEGRVIPVTKSSFPTLPLTGKLEWHVLATIHAPAHVAAGRPGVGEATLTRNLASQTGEIQVVLHEAEVRSTAHFEEMKQEIKLEMKREMERQMKRLQAQLLEGTQIISRMAGLCTRASAPTTRL
ncbi:hypothetical protein V8C86DRAFT_1221603 [Haematococcus lacustris]